MMDKAKAYDEALKIAQCWLNDPQTIQDCNYTIKDAIQNIFPQLKDSDDERISLEEFTEKMEDWKARFSYPDSIPVKATMAFTARMFCMYPDIAREWYDSLPKATQD